MPRLGAHVSIAGGLCNSIARALEIGCETFQIFTANQRRWKSPPIGDGDILSFREQLSGSHLGPVISHGSYLINLATPSSDLFERSVEALTEELMRCVRLGIPLLVMHPGSHLGSGVKAGSDRAAEGIDRALGSFEGVKYGGIPTVLLETTAGQGTSIGSSFEELSYILDRSRFAEKLGVCMDTCHIFAAGYDISDPDGFQDTIEALDHTVGLDRLKAVHLNDSPAGPGSRIDRHVNIGQGRIGPTAFYILMNDHRFRTIPMVLETPGGTEAYRADLRLLGSLSIDGHDAVHHPTFRPDHVVIR